MGPQGPPGPKGEPGEPGGGYMVGTILTLDSHFYLTVKSQNTKEETISVKQ